MAARRRRRAVIETDATPPSRDDRDILARATPFEKRKAPYSRAFSSAPGEIRTPDLRFRSSPFAAILS
jgi:hypothetical protein